MVQIAELDTIPETIEATLNYFVNTGGMPVTLVGEPGATDTRTGGGESDTRQRRVAQWPAPCRPLRARARRIPLCAP